ncbi:hypothetical protein [Roseofilum sp. Guam]|uniref:hypothetical protein n=1 Tax=Roseofilum sp. Guam TaxID=2821502 RepID=UPI001B2BE3DB|nr:hypothetical protein [Roseofilum sp. Guam]MBP0031502.1 hypothetical protein [Roseofilum sp. Guam]
MKLSEEFAKVITQAERATVRFFDGLEIDGYRMPDGEFRVGLEGVSSAVGFTKDWLPQAFRRDGKTLKALQGIGFTALQLEVSIGRSGRAGASKVKTISLNDFSLVIVYAASKGKKEALALQSSLTIMALGDFFRDAFGETPLTIDEKRRIFYESYAATISPENWRAMDKEEILALAFPGDEPHLAWGMWNQ